MFTAGNTLARKFVFVTGDPIPGISVIIDVNIAGRAVSKSASMPGNKVLFFARLMENARLRSECYNRCTHGVKRVRLKLRFMEGHFDARAEETRE